MSNRLIAGRSPWEMTSVMPTSRGSRMVREMSDEISAEVLGSFQTSRRSGATQRDVEDHFAEMLEIGNPTPAPAVMMRPAIPRGAHQNARATVEALLRFDKINHHRMGAGRGT